ncbi:hypothetical protein SLE2022_090220 [Rubroshorea leprosula]
MGMEIEEQQVESLSSMGKKLYVKNFIWSEEERPGINHNDFAKEEDIPVISLLEDHGVAIEILENAKMQLNKLFDLPMELKLKEVLQLLQSPEHVVSLAKRVFPGQHHPFSEAIIKYMHQLDRLGMRIFEMLAHGLGLPDDFFTKNFEKKEATIFRPSRCLPCPLPEKCLGLGSHSDPHTLTILLQDDDVGGLQILRDDNQWVGICPVPNSFIVNIGDTLEVWTNGVLKSRAVLNKGNQRQSVAYFLSPTSSAMIDSPPQLVDPIHNAWTFKPFTWGDFRNELISQKRVVGKTALNRYLITQ